MEIHEARVQYEIEGRGLVLTYDDVTTDPRYGTVRMKIWRKVGNDSGVKAQMTKELLEHHEPNVGMWPGDVIEIYDRFGQLIERRE